MSCEIRLLIVTTVPITAQGFLLPFVKHFQAKGWRVDLLSRDEKELEEMQSEFDNIYTTGWSRSVLNPRNLLCGSSIKRLVRKNQYTLVHSHTPIASFVTRFAIRNVKKQVGCSVIYTAHGFHFHSNGSVLKNLIFWGAEKIGAYWTDHLVVMNREDEVAAIRGRFLPPNHIQYMPGIGVDLELYSRNGEMVRRHMLEELDIPLDSYLFLVAGELSDRKRPFDVIRALQLLHRENVHAIFAGSGPLRLKLERLVDDAGLTDRVHFLGVRDDMTALLSSADCLILASQQEGLPRCVMEAMAVGTPIIGSDIRGTHDLLSGGCGMLYRCGDVEELTRKMAWTISHAEESQQMADKAKAVCRREYRVERIIALHERMYSQVMTSVYPMVAESMRISH